MVGGRCDNRFFDLLLEQKQHRNDDQQDADGGLDEVVDAVAVQVANVHQQLYAADRSGNASHGEGDHDLALYGALFEVKKTGGNLSEEVKKCIGADR